jgi:hypothetical protein
MNSPVKRRTITHVATILQVSETRAVSVSPNLRDALTGRYVPETWTRSGTVRPRSRPCPPELPGRDAELTAFDVALERVERG